MDLDNLELEPGEEDSLYVSTFHSTSSDDPSLPGLLPPEGVWPAELCWPPQRLGPARRDPSWCGPLDARSCVDSRMGSALSSLAPRHRHDSRSKLAGPGVSLRPSCWPSPPCPSTLTWPGWTSSPPLSSTCCLISYSGPSSGRPGSSPATQTVHDAGPASSLSHVSRRSQMVARIQKTGWTQSPSCCSVAPASFRLLFG